MSADREFLAAFADLITTVRRSYPYVLGRDVWHIDSPTGILCRTTLRDWGPISDLGGVTRSEIDICRNCQRIANANIGVPPEAVIPRGVTAEPA